jgi:hypothetical protein
VQCWVNVCRMPVLTIGGWFDDLENFAENVVTSGPVAAPIVATVDVAEGRSVEDAIQHVMNEGQISADLADAIKKGDYQAAYSAATRNGEVAKPEVQNWLSAHAPMVTLVSVPKQQAAAGSKRVSVNTLRNIPHAAAGAKRVSASALSKALSSLPSGQVPPITTPLSTEQYGATSSATTTPKKKIPAGVIAAGVGVAALGAIAFFALRGKKRRR